MYSPCSLKVFMNYATVKYNDVANGPGVRVSLFVSGCRHRCKGCFNREAWDFNYGNEFDGSVIDSIISALEHGYVEGLSLLGGEPLEPENQEGVLALVKRVRELLPKKTVWCYTGFCFEELLEKVNNGNAVLGELLSLIDVIVDGRFVEDKKDASLIFRGSSNQRILDLKASISQGKAVLLDGVWKRKMGSTDIYEV